MIKYLEKENLNDVIKSGVWIVDFYADWCGPCKMLGPVLESIDANILKINVDTHEELATTYGVMSIPTICFFKDGELKVLSKEGQKTNEKLFLSQKLIDYILCPGTKNFYHDDAEIDLPIARALLSTMGNTHRASVNNYVTTNGKIRALDPRETHRLMGFPDDYKIVVSKAQAYKQSGNSIVVSVLKHILDSIYGG